MSRFFINRPIVAMVIAILMVVIGLVSALALPVMNSQTSFLPKSAKSPLRILAPMPRRWNNRWPRRWKNRSAASTT